MSTPVSSQRIVGTTQDVGHIVALQLHKQKMRGVFFLPQEKEVMVEKKVKRRLISVIH